jgi:hypothetical protein
VTRRKLLYSFLASTAVALPYPCFFEPRWLDYTEKRVRLPRAHFAQPVRLLHLADLHASVFVTQPMIRHAINRGLAARPDVIVLTGDFITMQRDFDADAYARELRRLSEFAPTYAVLGNHDGGLWSRHHYGLPDHRTVERILEDSQISLLHNRAVRPEFHGQRITLAGVGDLWADEVDGRRALQTADPSAPIVLLAHNPDTKDAVRGRWDLMLSGHTHGGQILVPFRGARYAPVKDKRYIAGLKPWGTRQIHVTRGVGNIGGVRMGCRPEASLLILENA